MKHTFAAALMVIVAVFAGSEARAEFDLRFGLGAGLNFPHYIENEYMIDDAEMAWFGLMAEISLGYRFDRSFGLYADLYYTHHYDPLGIRTDEVPPAWPSEEAALYVTPRVYAEVWKMSFYAGLGIGVSYRYNHKFLATYHEPNIPTYYKVTGNNVLSWASLKPEAGIDFQISRRFTLGVAFQAIIYGWQRIRQYGEKVEVVDSHFGKPVRGRYIAGYGSEFVPLMVMIRSSYR